MRFLPLLYYSAAFAKAADGTIVISALLSIWFPPDSETYTRKLNYFGVTSSVDPGTWENTLVSSHCSGTSRNWNPCLKHPEAHQLETPQTQTTNPKPKLTHLKHRPLQAPAKQAMGGWCSQMVLMPMTKVVDCLWQRSSVYAVRPGVPWFADSFRICPGSAAVILVA